MVTSIYEALDLVRNGRHLSEQSVRALRDFVMGFQIAAGRDFARIESGSPPFRYFAGWLEKRFGSVVLDRRTGSVTGSSKGWFMIIVEKYGESDRAYKEFFSLLDEFRSERPHILATVELPIEQQTRLTDCIPDCKGFTVMQYVPDDGAYLTCYKSSGITIDLGLKPADSK